MKNRLYSIFVIVICFCGCKSAGMEVQRVPSPDNLVDAVLVDVSGGALSPFLFKLYIVPKGRKISDDEPGPIMEISRFSGLWISWRSACFLEIHYRRGEVFEFRNIWESRDIYGYSVEARLLPESLWTIDMFPGTKYHEVLVRKIPKPGRIVFPESMFSKLKTEQQNEMYSKAKNERLK